MKIKNMLITAVMLEALVIFGTSANSQVSEQSARDKALSVAHVQLGLSFEVFLDIHRDEALEEELASVVGGLNGSEFIYRVSQAGDEIKDHVVIHHIFMDSDSAYWIAVNPVDGSVYRIAGFRDSKAELNRLLAALNINVSNEDQAEGIADFYRTVNPERYSLTKISGLLDLKQAAELQCQAVKFDPHERNFLEWWKHAKTVYAHTSFQETSTRIKKGYAIEWVVLSSPSADFCGGAALRVRLQVGSDGSIGEINFGPV